jgi:hypothetical protein
MVNLYQNVVEISQEAGLQWNVNKKTLLSADLTVIHILTLFHVWQNNHYLIDIPPRYFLLSLQQCFRQSDP